MNILEELKLSKKQSNDERYEYLCSQFNAVYYAMKLEKYTIKLQRENKQLKEQVQDLKADYGTIAQIERDLYKEVIEEVRDRITIKLGRYINEKDYVIDDSALDELLQILDKVKD